MILSLKLPTSLFSVYSLTDSEFYVGAKSTSSGLSWVDGGSLIKPVGGIAVAGNGECLFVKFKDKNIHWTRGDCNKPNLFVLCETTGKILCFILFCFQTKIYLTCLSGQGCEKIY